MNYVKGLLNICMFCVNLSGIVYSILKYLMIVQIFNISILFKKLLIMACLFNY